MTQTAAASSAGMGSRYWTTRLLRADEDVALAGLARACFGDRADSLEFIRSRYTHSTGPEAHVLVADAGGTLVGAQAVTFLPFVVCGHDVKAGMFTGGMTHPEHRKRGVFRDVVEAAERHAFAAGAAFLFTMPNDESLPAFQKSPTWRCLPDRPLRAFPLNVKRLLADRGWPGAVASVAGWVGDARYGSRWRKPPASVEERAGLASVAVELDRLAEAVGRRHGGIMCRRDGRFVCWRFCENPTFRYRYFVSHGTDGLDGYLITTAERRLGTRLVHVVDWLAMPGTNALPALLSAAARAARADDASLLTMIAAGGVELDRFAAFGFRRVPARLAGRGFHTACALNPARADLSAIVTADAAWYLTLADFDTI